MNIIAEEPDTPVINLPNHDRNILMPRPKDSEYSNKAGGRSNQTSLGDRLIQLLILIWGLGMLIVITSI